MNRFLNRVRNPLTIDFGYCLQTCLPVANLKPVLVILCVRFEGAGDKPKVVSRRLSYLVRVDIKSMICNLLLTLKNSS